MRQLSKMNVIEAAYQLDESSADEWIRGLGVAFSAASGLQTAAAFTYEFVDDRIHLGATWDERLAGLMDLRASHAALPRDQHDVLYGRALMASGLRERLGAIQIDIEDAPAWPVIRDTGGHDLFGLPGLDLDGHGVAISGVSGKRGPSEEDRHAWSCVAAHVACAYRLRRALTGAPAIDRAAAVFSPDGELDHAENHEVLSARDLLRHAIRQVDRARCVGVDQQEACALWQGLVDGRWSIVDHFMGGGRRYYAVIHNPPEAQVLRGLSGQEQTALGYVMGGTSNKIAAYALGQSESAYSRVTQRALRKVGVSSRAALIELASLLDAQRQHGCVEQSAEAARAYAQDVQMSAVDMDGVSLPVLTAAPLPCPDTFSAAEREIAWLLVDGRSSAEIAKARATSLRTVANQLASMYGKCGVASREELVAALLGRAGT